MGRKSMKVRGLGLMLLAVAITVCSVSVAGAASVKHGVRLLSPKNGAIIPTVIASGKTPTFKARVRGKGVVYFRVCKSKKRDKQGQICGNRAPDDIDRGKKGKRTKKGRNYSYKPIAYTFPSYYLNTPGTYYWQVYRIDCVRRRNGSLDCLQESPLHKFKVQ